MNRTNEDHRYDDIIDLPHHVSPTRPRMSAIDRAAQFSPFAALTGYDSAIKETERLTSERMELDESAKTILNEKLLIIMDALDQQPEVTIIYFQPDKKKAGGAYISTTGIVEKIDEYSGIISLSNGERLSVDQIYEIESDLFRRTEFK